MTCRFILPVAVSFGNEMYSVWEKILQVFTVKESLLKSVVWAESGQAGVHSSAEQRRKQFRWLGGREGSTNLPARRQRT
ncbi:hypothetical protein [Rubinisphaera sp. JC750]|uniref:hypothetical protein n=1 Tax=Rubinisphaera sp. JC750 TaxID=2898658 RepID=UPI001F2310B6|nr:hypothetical protein [Rubinisphaera sp. JC750]